MAHETFMNRLYLLRHAKSSWSDPALADFDRPLNKRGRRACKALAQYIRDSGIRPELILSSSAKRALETLEALLPSLDHQPEIRLDKEIYHADARALSDHVAKNRGESSSVMVIGHNPAVHMLALGLSVACSDVSYRDMSMKYPTGGLAILEAEGEAWSRMTPGGFTLIDFIKPRDLAD